MKQSTLLIIILILINSIIHSQEVKHNLDKNSISQGSDKTYAPQATGDTVTVKDDTGNVLMTVTDEGSAGSIKLKDAGAVSPSTDKLYNNGGSLYWNGSALNTGSGGATQLKELTDVQYDGSSLYIGNNAGGTNDDGNNSNTAVGKDVLNSNTTGIYNTAIGSSTLNRNTAGASNTAIGYSALYSNTTGNNNTAIGSGTLYLNTTGIYNTAIGVSTLNNNTTANSNTAIGYSALTFNTTGSKNVGIGYQVNFLNQAGSNNTIIGYEAGRGISSLHNKSGNVFLGYQAGYNEISDNKLYIENSNSSTPLIWGDFANDKVAINGNLGVGTTPGEKIHLNTPSDSDMKIFFSENGTPAASIFYEGSAGAGTNNLIHMRSEISGSEANMMTWKLNGNVGIGTTSPSFKLHVVDNSGGTEVAMFHNTVKGTDSDGIIIRAGIDVNPGNGADYLIFQDGDGSTIGVIDGDGTGGVNYGSSSDRRLKTKIRNFKDAIKTIAKIQVRLYERKAKPGIDEIGFIAQEIQKVYPQIVSGSPDNVETNPMMVDYGKITPLLVAAIQEQNEKIKKLEEENDKLVSVINEIKEMKTVLNRLIQERPKTKLSIKQN